MLNFNPAAPAALQKRGKNARRRHVFTLVEMLVVVAIIAILVALLAPALRKALATAKMAQCVSNLTQCNQTIQLYLNDNRDRLLTNDSSLSWGFQMENGGYMNTGLKALLNCPLPLSVRMIIKNGGRYEYNHVYGYNLSCKYRPQGAKKTDSDTNAWRKYIKPDGTATNTSYLFCRTDIKSPANYVLLGDNRGRTEWNGQRRPYPEYKQQHFTLSKQFPIAFVHRYGAGVTSFLDGSTRLAEAGKLLECYSKDEQTAFFDTGDAP